MGSSDPGTTDEAGEVAAMRLQAVVPPPAEDTAAVRSDPGAGHNTPSGLADNDTIR